MPPPDPPAVAQAARPAHSSIEGRCGQSVGHSYFDGLKLTEKGIGPSK